MKSTFGPVSFSRTGIVKETDKSINKINRKVEKKNSIKNGKRMNKYMKQIVDINRNKSGRES